jgi:3-oxoacyl-ACP reductase-like protein
MAKAKKTESAESKSSESKPPKAAAAPAKKGKAGPSKGSSSGGAQMGNNEFAAQSAARMLMARATGAPIDQTAGKKESSTFKNLKNNIAKPHLASMDNVLNSTGNISGQKSNLPFSQTNQKGHNQTYGADVNRAGVPRRTPG